VSTAIIVVAAGSGTRLGEPEPKAFVDIAGRSILEHALEAVFAVAEPLQLVVVAPADRVDRATAIATSVAGAAAGHVHVVAGGDTRQASVAAGLSVIDPAVDIVLVHDSARALTPTAQIEAVIAAVRAGECGVIPGLAVADTIKRTRDGEALDTVDRSELVAVQTPQGFPRAQLVDAYAAATREYTDDAALFAEAGHQVRVIPGDASAFKITTPWDLRRAHALIAERAVQRGERAAPRDAAPRAAPSPPAVARTGIGIDVHAYDPSVELWLGGLHWPGEAGLAGHSDGDAIAHAMCDALLSAAGLGDIGGRFGTADPRFADARGDIFLSETVKIVSEAGFGIVNVAVQLVALRPKLAARRVEIEQHLSQVIGAPVSVSATTSDGLGFTGRGEGVAAIATALLSR